MHKALSNSISLLESDVGLFQEGTSEVQVVRSERLKNFC